MYFCYQPGPSVQVMAWQRTDDWSSVDQRYFALLEHNLPKTGDT